MRNAIYITQNTFSEALRQKLLILIALAALLLVFSSNYLMRLDMGGEKLRFIFDFGSGAMEFFGAIIAIIASCQAFHSEMENKTVVTLLSKPVNFGEFVFGKFFGVCATIASFVAIIAAATIFMIIFTMHGFEDSPRQMVRLAKCNYAGVLAFSFLQFAKLCTLAAIVSLVCSFSRSLLFSAVVGFMALAISLMGSAIVGLGGSKNFVSKFADLIFPDFQIFSASQAFAFEPVDFKVFGSLLAYALIYSFCSCAIAAWSFSRREF